ncbi:MAG: hypothetical protein VYE77_09450 [Planctomycetota bacterium]|nr:hypothetical protein [Planctomycetota bacterium]
MQLFVKLTLSSIALFAQGALAQEQKALLSASEQKSLRTKLAKLIEADQEFEMAPAGRQRQKAAKAYDSAKAAFVKDWDARMAKKGNVLGSMPDLQAIFDNVFAYPRKSGLSMRKVAAKDGIPAHVLSVPKKYKNTSSWPTVLVLPGRDGDSWSPGLGYFKSLWDKAPSLATTIYHVALVPDSLELDPVPDFMTPEGDATEKQRLGELLRSFGETQRNYNVDRSRLFLDAGKGTCGFAVRAASYFPERFAGLILRDPVAVDDVRIGSLTGLPVLLLSTGDNADVCAKLKERFDGLGENACTIIETTDAYPFKAANVEIDKWMAGVQRKVDRQKVVIEPNHEQFKKAYWVIIDTMDPIHTAPLDKRPRVEAEVDRTDNRINIKAVGVESILLTLNDSLVDLDKEFTIVINDKAVSEKRSRDFNTLLSYAQQRFDTDFLFPVQLRLGVPTSDATPAEPGGGN